MDPSPLLSWEWVCLFCELMSAHAGSMLLTQDLQPVACPVNLLPQTPSGSCSWIKDPATRSRQSIDTTSMDSTIQRARPARWASREDISCPSPSCSTRRSLESPKRKPWLWTPSKENCSSVSTKLLRLAALRWTVFPGRTLVPTLATSPMIL